MTRLLLAAILFAFTFALGAQKTTFQFISAAPDVAPAAGQVVVLDQAALFAQLREAPREGVSRKELPAITLPLPNGGSAVFSATYSPLFPGRKELGSYRMTGPWGTGRLATSPRGISGVLAGPNGRFVIEPLPRLASGYQVVEYGAFLASGEGTQSFSCGFDGSRGSGWPETAPGADAGAGLGDPDRHVGAKSLAKSGGEARELRVYDIVMTNVGEFGQAVGGDTSDVLAAFNTAVNAVNSIFEPELGVRLQLVEIPALVFLDPATDPYTDVRDGEGLLNQVFNVFADNSIPTALYDIGHIFTRSCDDNLGGIAVRGSACTINRSQGVTCVSGSVQQAALGVMAHELGHQFSATHSWNNCPPAQNQRSAVTAFEPGAGTTIMSYANSCGNQSIGPRDPYYHVGNLQQMLRFTRETGAADCATVIETSNFSPDVSLSYTDGFSIPVSTPFRLTGTATDANGDDLLYNWEQVDSGPAASIQEPTGTSPLFRSVPPDAEGNLRYFPRFDRILSGTSGNDEVLPTYSRGLKFRLTARDYHPEAGGVDWEQVEFAATDEAGPFLVNEPAASDWAVGETQTVTWEVANTDKQAVDCQRVDILLSTDGGATFDVVLAENAPNIGSALVTVPATAVTQNARLMIAAADNVFLNVNRREFRVAAASQAAFTLEADTRYAELCTPATTVIPISSGSVLGFSAPIRLSIEATDVPAGVGLSLADNTLTPGATTTVEVDVSSVDFTGRLRFNVVGVAAGQDTARRLVVLDLINTDFSDLSLARPAEGTTGIEFTTDFVWTTAGNADTYDFQLATSPAFSPGTIVAEDSLLGDTTFSPTDLLEVSTVHYWRVRPRNECGAGPWRDPAAFQTINLACNRLQSADTPISLPGSGPAFTRTSSIFVEAQGAISDVNLPDVQVNYNFVSKITLTLISPAGTRVELYKENCRISTGQIDLGFDDDIATAPSCPTIGNRVFNPVGTLADFNGEDTFGNWTLEVSASETNGTAGAIESWELEFCSSVDAIPPSQITNLITEVPPLERNAILNDKLLANSPVFPTVDVTYTLTALPTAGRLYLYRNELTVGSEFSQADINGAGLVYENTSGEEGTDAFGFVVTTPDGGFLGVDYHDIVIDADAIVSNRTVSPVAESLAVFPNPFADRVQVRWSAVPKRTLVVELFDPNGRRLQRQTVAGQTGAATLTTAGLPAGLYLLRVDGVVRRIVKR